MYLSHLLVDVGDNPDRPRPGRLWLRNRYRVHQRLCMAFPSATRKRDDPAFLRPYRHNDFGNSHVHISRAPDRGFLFRVDPLPGGRTMLVVQSAVPPDWDYAFHNADYLLAAKPEVRPYDPSFAKGDVLRFLLDANPTKRLRRDSRERNGEKVKEKWVGKRIPVPYDAFVNWLQRRADAAGFKLAQDSVTVRAGYVYVDKRRPGDAEPAGGNGDGGKVAAAGQRLRAVRYEGVLTVTDAGKFRDALARGIGPAKAYGFGLLSVAPAR